MILIILPVRNESKTIKETCQKLVQWCNENFSNYHIMFINDHSTDDTDRKIWELKNPRVNIVMNSFDEGKGSALKTGFVFSNLMYSMNPDDLVVFMDGDGQIDPKEIRPIINRMRLDMAEVGIGNKRHTYSIIEYSFLRNIVSRCYNLIIRILFGIDFQDTQCGIKIFRKRALDKVIDKITSKKYAFDLELIIALRYLRLKIIDSPVVINTPMNRGSVSLSSMIRTFMDTISIWIKIKKGFYKL